MPRLIAIVLLTGAGLVWATPPPEAPEPKLLDSYRADHDLALPSLASGFSYGVTPYAFSPDEQWLALLVYPRATRRGVTTVPGITLLLLQLPSAGGRRVEIHPGTRIVAFLWSPDSRSVVVQPLAERKRAAARIYNLRGELVWTAPQSGPLLGFVAPTRLLARHAKADGRLAGFETIDIQTASVTPWRAKRHWRFAAIDYNRGRLAMFNDPEGSRTLIVDYATGRVVQSVKNQNQTTIVSGSTCGIDQTTICDMNVFAAPQVFFAENGSTLCEAALVGAFQSHPTCHDLDTGTMIAELRDVDGGAPAGASTRGSRMLLSQLIYVPGGNVARSGAPTIAGAESYRGRVVWDFRLGAEVAAWGASTPHAVRLGLSRASGLSAPYAVISPSGHYVAEAPGDELHIYQIS